MNFIEFKNKYEKVPVEHYTTNAPEDPFVSVCVQTYQHADYIEYCLKGILKQETDFPIEILLGEDSSTDGTREICIRYANKYPDKIRLFLHKRENNIEIGGQPTGRYNFLYNLYSVRGKYIALCEGDDYWTDPLKLQKQVEFMEENPCYSLIHTDHNYKDEETGELKEARWKRAMRSYNEEKNCAPFLVSDEYDIATCTALMRATSVHKIFEDYSHEFGEKYIMGDNQLWFHLARKSKIKYLNEVTATYRRHFGGATSVYRLEKRLEFIKNVYWQRRTFAKRYGYDEVIPTIDKKYLRSLIKLNFELGNFDKFKQLYQKYFGLQNTNWVDMGKILLQLLKRKLFKSA